MMKCWSLRAKLTAWSALTVGVAMVISSICTSLFIREEQIEALDEQLRNEAHVFFGEYARTGGGVNWNETERVRQMLPLTLTERYVEIADTASNTLYLSPNLQGNRVAGHPDGMQTIRVGRDSARLGVFREHGLRLYLAADLREIDGDTHEVLIGFLLGVPLLLGTVALGGWWLARTALAPIGEIISATEEITADRLDRRLAVPPGRDEIGRLATVLNAMLNRLDRSFRQASRFTSDASHELKTPLTLLRAGIEDLIGSPTLFPADQAAAVTLLEQTRRLSSITESLLLLARADAGRLRLDLQERDVMETLRACVEDAEILAEPRGISITMADAPFCLARIDSDRFSQVVLNLLDNAVKYNRQQGSIRVETGRCGGRLRIVIANTGREIPSDRAPELFERFVRWEPQPDTPGHGLGLSLARELARAHNGDVVFEGSRDGWTTFVLYLPIAAPDHRRLEPEPHGCCTAS